MKQKSTMGLVSLLSFHFICAVLGIVVYLTIVKKNTE
jgi:cbb3-type cytochrome oxidase subunit 1